MVIPYAPGWPTIIISGLVGGAANWGLSYLYPQIGALADILGFVVFTVGSSIGIVLRNRRLSRA